MDKIWMKGHGQHFGILRSVHVQRLVLPTYIFSQPLP